MTVKELIEKLEQFPENAMVYRDTGDNGGLAIPHDPYITWDGDVIL